MSAIINEFLRRCIQSVNGKRNITVVLGNEGGDMDSIIGSIFLAFYLEKRDKLEEKVYIPLLNFEKDDLPLRGDVVKLCSLHGISTEDLFSAKGQPGMKDYINLRETMPNVVLYDHNKLISEQSFLADKIIGIVDHHFDEKMYMTHPVEFRYIENTGSACTLVSELFQKSNLSIPCPELLLAPIVLDTVNFNPAQKKVTERDINASEWLLGQIAETINVERLFINLSLWKNDILGLSITQNLRRDFKSFEFDFQGSETRALSVGISSIACCFDELIKSSSVKGLAEECLQFLINRRLDLLLLTFAGERGAGNYCRQIGVFAKDRPLAAMTAFAESAPDGVLFTPLTCISHNSWTLNAYELSDPSVSRKKLVPSLVRKRKMVMHFTPENMEIGVLEPIWCNGHVEYKVCIWFSTCRDTPLSSVYRRFSEIYLVLENLVELEHDPVLPPLPRKRFFGTSDPSFIEQRRKELDTFLKAVCRNRFLVKDSAFLTLVGFQNAKTALALERRRNNQLDDPSKDIFLPWLLNDLPSVDEESMFLAARQLLRSTPYTLIRVLPPISFKSSHRFRALLKKAEKEYILSVIQIHPKRGVKLSESKKGDRVCRLLERPLLPFLFTPDNVYTDDVHLYIIRRVISDGSLRDRAYGARWSDESRVKYSGTSKPYRVDYIASVVKQGLLMFSALHALNIPCPHVNLGKCFDDDGQVLFSGLEDILLGITFYPPVLLTVTQTHTHIDILLLGVLALEMALGTPLSTKREIGLTVMHKDPTGTVDADNDLRVNFVTQLLHDLPRTIPQEVASFVRVVFDPTRKVELADLLGHPLLTKAKFTYKHREYGMKDYVFPSVELKRKEIELFHEVAQASTDHIKQATLQMCRKEESRLLLKEIRQRGSSHGSSDVPCLYDSLRVSGGLMMNEPPKNAPPPVSSSTGMAPSAVQNDPSSPKQHEESLAAAPPVSVSSSTKLPPPPPPPPKGLPPPPPPPPPPPKKMPSSARV